MKFFRQDSKPHSGPGAHSGAEPHLARRNSSGFRELSKLLVSQEGLCVLDLGSTSPANIRYLTGHGHKTYSEDVLLASTDSSLTVRDDEGRTSLDDKRFFAENLVYPPAHFDVVLGWNLPDYLDESLVKPLVGRVWSILKPGGVLLAYFHTHDAGPDAPCYRFHVVNNETLEMQPLSPAREGRRWPGARSQAGGFRLQRVFNNRHIENLFRDYASIKFFLARDNIREVLVVR
jgi:SAM-dependent methyltransferase